MGFLWKLKKKPLLFLYFKCHLISYESAFYFVVFPHEIDLTHVATVTPCGVHIFNAAYEMLDIVNLYPMTVQCSKNQEEDIEREKIHFNWRNKIQEVIWKMDYFFQKKTFFYAITMIESDPT